jgi:hypothetical protein
VLKIFDKTVWLWRRIDPLLPWPGLSLIMVARKSRAATPSRSRDGAGTVSRGLARQ